MPSLMVAVRRAFLTWLESPVLFPFTFAFIAWCLVLPYFLLIAHFYGSLASVGVAFCFAGVALVRFIQTYRGARGTTLKSSPATTQSEQRSLSASLPPHGRPLQSIRRVKSSKESPVSHPSARHGRRANQQPPLPISPFAKSGEEPTKPPVTALHVPPTAELCAQVAFERHVSSASSRGDKTKSGSLPVPSPSPEIIRNLDAQFRRVADHPLVRASGPHTSSGDRMVEAWRTDPYNVKMYEVRAIARAGMSGDVDVDMTRKSVDSVDRGSSEEIVEDVDDEEPYRLYYE